ncbi:TolC family protein [Desulfosediminicola sp.]|uniref:TolC family protein n=1 Tax=Desulfosediminicola sp. TaxID=2886825 RepID=UPI003AF26671
MYRMSSLFSFLVISLTLFAPGQLRSETSQLGLNDLIEIALQQNPQIEIARQQLAGDAGILTQAKSGYLPRLGTTADYGRVYVDGLSPEDEDNVASLLLTLSQLIYDFGRTTGLIDASAFNVAASEENLRQVYHDVVLDVKNQFYDVLESQELIVVAEEAVANYTRQLYRARKYLEAGIRTRIDVTNAEVNLANERLGLVQAKADLQSARVALEQTLGGAPNNGDYQVVIDETGLGDLVTDKPPIPDTLNNLLVTAEQNRPGLSGFGYLIEAAEANLRSAKGDYWPSIGVTGSYTGYDTDISSLNDTWQVGVGATWELFSGFETEGLVAEAKANLREVTAGYRQFNLSVTQQVTDSYLRAVENKEGVDIAGQSLGLAEENLELADKRYQTGLGDWLEFNDAQLLLTQNQTNLVVTYYTYLRSLARIEWSTGVIPELQDRTYR